MDQEALEGPSWGPSSLWGPINGPHFGSPPGTTRQKLMFRSNLVAVLHSASSDWFMNGNYLIIIVTLGIILPLAMMKHLGMCPKHKSLDWTSPGTSNHFVVISLERWNYIYLNKPCVQLTLTVTVTSSCDFLDCSDFYVLYPSLATNELRWSEPKPGHLVHLLLHPVIMRLQAACCFYTYIKVENQTKYYILDMLVKWILYWFGVNQPVISCHCPPGYLGYTSGFSLSCMVFFLSAVSYDLHQEETPERSHWCDFSRHNFFNEVCLCPRVRWSTRGSTSAALCRRLATTRWVKSHQRRCARPNCSPSTRRSAVVIDRHSITVVELAHANHPELTPGRSQIKLLLVFVQTAYTIPILAFAFVCHPEVLPIYTELRK